MSAGPPPGSLGAALRAAASALDRAGCEAPREQAEILLGELLGLGRGALLARSREPLPPDVETRFAALVARRAAREPLQHLVGHWPFLELELKVDRRALVPRPETEELALAARERLPRGRAALAADVGTGTGAVALALAASHPAARVLAVDVSADALALCRENRDALGLEDRVRLARGDLLGALAPGAGFDVVVANLPYVAPEEWPELQPEVRDHDPRLALVAEDGGLALIRRLCAEAPARLAADGWLLLEMAPAQTAVVAAELAPAWRDVAVLRDRFDRARIVVARRGA